jgi:hypothetical protein
MMKKLQSAGSIETSLIIAPFAAMIFPPSIDPEVSHRIPNSRPVVVGRVPSPAVTVMIA